MRSIAKFDVTFRRLRELHEGLQNAKRVPRFGSMIIPYPLWAIGKLAATFRRFPSSNARTKIQRKESG
jgi:hypothetical protein